MKPYYERGGVTLYHGAVAAARFPQIVSFDRAPVVITDPVWPNGERAFPGIDAWALWAETAPWLARIAARLVVVLGVDSDPRFLNAVPHSMPFARVIYLRHAQPRGVAYRVWCSWCGRRANPA